MRPITEIIVHCTATRADWWASKPTSAKVAEIRRWHVQDRGWRDIGYHYLIDRDGTVATGRPLAQVGAHTQGHNTGTIGISLFGGHGSSENDAFEEHFTPEQDAALRKLIAGLKSEFGITKVSGHNQYAAKACPGFNVPRWLERKTAARSTVAQSKTVQAGAAGLLATVTTGATALGSLDRTAQIIVATAVVIAGAAFLWVIRDRVKKWAAGVK
ncbi:N-acetylmuramoyl-L-alanine amidase [Maritimibacter sp. DP1N21-5]|uniref:N-acetylmuramoyl-L-alanine amidase n=1 Tax=Maritimibacter sp. DP1N21-5 TaxID=2836867 RepID=UPI001C46E802|nr:N-acetylmuramoyl-L-alanine amidase [Maritimibacter sp. DP1N21-5]MBV7408211.1 N-acetylmuramoyl-L-alanine amidase [Maritimibacter sp. DP1N21-5]